MVWWSSLLTAVLTGSVTGTLAYLGIRRTVSSNDQATGQRELAARREEWWRRLTWAAELALSEAEEKRTAGFMVLDKLSDSELADLADIELLNVFTSVELRGVLEAGSIGRHAARRDPDASDEE